jgi:hypothetical protein
MSTRPHVFYPRNLRWRALLIRLALVNELLVLVGAVSMHAGGILGKQTLAEPGLLYQLVWMHFIGWSSMLVLTASALSFVRRAWRHMPDPAEHYERHGAYLGLLPADRLRLVAISLASVLAAAYMGRTLLAACLPWLARTGPAPFPPYELAVFNAAYGTLVTYAFEFFHDRAIWSRHRAEKARQLSAQAQLDLLRSQLEPHMLFNTLANVNDLIDEDPPQAKAMLHSLIAFLRATLQSSQVVAHPLSAEFQLVADYLALMQIRMGERLKADLTLPAPLAALPVPAMLLQPLVENAIQHGLAPRRAGGFVRIEAQWHAPYLSLVVCNSGGQAHAATQGSGFGLRCVADRLKALYGELASIELQHLPHEDTTVVTIRLPCSTAPSPQPA